MENFRFLFPVFLAGIGAVTLIDITGSITSRKYNFNYGYFTIFSLVIYIGIAAQVYLKTANSFTTVGLILPIGIYDGTIGWWISKKLKANYGNFAEEANNITIGQALLTILLYSMTCAGIGIFIASEIKG